MFKKILKKDIFIILYAFIFILFIIIAGIKYSSNILKEEIVNKQLKITQLNANFLAEELNININNIEVFIENIASIIDLQNDQIAISNSLFRSLDKFPQIRSINIINKNKILYSSNNKNIGFNIKNYNFIPKPLFNNNIIRVSSTKKGRDVYSTLNDISSNKNIDDSYIPILKEAFINGEKYSVMINLNTNYFFNKFKNTDKDNNLDIQLLRIDKKLLISTNKSSIPEGKIESNYILEKALQFNKASDVYDIDNDKIITSYSLTKDYPFILGIKLDYKKSLLDWNEKSYQFFIISTIIIFICMIVVLIFILLFKRGKEREVLEKNKFKLLFQDSHLMTVMINKSGQIENINNLGLEFLGKKELKEVKKTNFWDLDCWEINEKNKIKKFFESNRIKKRINLQIKALDINKKIAIFDFTLYTIDNIEDEFNYIAITEDITEKKRKERRLEQSYTVFNHTRDGIIITDKDTNIIDVNKAFEQITGYSKKDTKNRTTRILKSSLNDKKFYDEMWKSINEQGFWEGEISNLNKKREIYTEWLTINTIYDENSQVLNYIGIFSDITEQKNKDQEINEKQRLLFQQSKMASLGEMIENIAHQWRQPLSVISTASTGIKIKKELDILSDEEELKSLDTINHSAQFLSTTIDDFRSYLINDNKKDNFNVGETIDYSLKLFSSKLHNRNITIIKDYEDTYIWGIRNEFVQVLINIINNANDAFEAITQDEKYIFISTRQIEQNIEIEIKDNAGGIPEKILEKVFDPYFTTKDKSQGTGIGLYMSSQMIRNHMDGHIHVKNKTYKFNNIKCTGASFIVTLKKGNI
ncbi:PAS domain-containing sensor histidine kinase [Poseidonibacter lekithochrous]|uniref:PAS domain-containing sensor histidine kinase n=1 Tax=Poseidonibacter TaxID=2321187 RepID=UPI001C09EC0E|nr:MULTISPECIES: PAS domain-containing sensor histidine kinase [Poseidonibacter]MBU3015886.1 PAS domain-containing sensor histidine kinase [Poseidonibacter lekithochrous]MDO6829185.1 PAS domain-containing sensor histidine kinase [Poseidonibacter sp. 1_MG-2023]